MFYHPLILNDNNWERFKLSLGDYPVRFSSLSKLESNINVRSIALKYVYRGNENYLLNNERYCISDNQFLLVNKFSKCEVAIHHTIPSRGICIDLREDYFSDAMASLKAPGDIDNLEAGKRFFLSDELFSQGMQTRGTLHKKLKQLTTFVRSKDGLLLDDFLRDITYAVIESQGNLILEYNQVPAIKSSTKKELYRRLLKSRSILQDASLAHLSIAEVGKMVCLSEFRFHHLFRKTFGDSPLQFRLKSILQTALSLHRRQTMSWVEIAEKTGFPDLQTFSKSFKKMFGASPRKFTVTGGSGLKEKLVASPENN